MADEAEVENLPPQEGGGGTEKPKAKKSLKSSPILPILLVVVLAPALSYLTTNFLLVPKVKAALAEVGKPSPGAVAADAQAKEVKEVRSREAEDGVKYTYDFANIIANLSGALHSRYIKVSFTIEGTDPSFIEKAEMNKAKLIDATLGSLTALSVKDLEQPGVRNMLRSDLLSAFERTLNSDMVEQLYFSEFVVQ